MKILTQIGIVFGVYWISQCIEAVLPFSFPASVISLLLWLISIWFSLRWLNTAAFVIMVWACWRSYSKNIPKRRQENDTFLRLVHKPKSWFGLQRNRWRDRKTHRYFHCSGCKAVLRVPKGRGMVEITCPKCGAVIRKKT